MCKGNKSNQTSLPFSFIVSPQSFEFALPQLCELWKTEEKRITNTWTIESGPKAELSASSVLGGTAPAHSQWYVSFILQDTSNNEKLNAEFESKTLAPLPLRELPTTDDCVVHGPCVWFFFGENQTQDNAPLRGRSEHIDQVFHSGTWHLQASGSKVCACMCVCVCLCFVN